MKNIVLLGAGRSASALIQYLLKWASENDFFVRIGDKNLSVAEEKISNHPRGQAFAFDVQKYEDCQSAVQNAAVIVSLLPAHLHVPIAQACIEAGVSMLTASYISPAMQALHNEAESKNIMILNEIGLDPGIDHLSAMEVLDDLNEAGANITCFKSFCGGLVAPNSDTNLWGYKFSWNPRNVILAGQSTAKFMQNGQTKFVPYQRLFTYTEPIHFSQIGDFEGYPNRDSLSYLQAYRIQKVPTVIRGTIRKKGFSDAWNVFVQLGLTDDSYIYPNSAETTYRSFLNSYFQYDQHLSLEDKLKKMLHASMREDVFERINSTGILEDNIIGLDKATPAQILQQLLEEKWRLEPSDKDMVLMQHIFKYQLEGQNRCLRSSLVVIGQDNVQTAMAQTVGLPLGIATKLFLEKKIMLKGVLMPLVKELYRPILSELESCGIAFREHSTDISELELYN